VYGGASPKGKNFLPLKREENVLNSTCKLKFWRWGGEKVSERSAAAFGREPFPKGVLSDFHKKGRPPMVGGRYWGGSAGGGNQCCSGKPQLPRGNSQRRKSRNLNREKRRKKRREHARFLVGGADADTQPEGKGGNNIPKAVRTKPCSSSRENRERAHARTSYAGGERNYDRKEERSHLLLQPGGTCYRKLKKKRRLVI